jgi:hydroxymethylpyrimidine pyrophosphatase-like HAD family hydrolase
VEEHLLPFEGRIQAVYSVRPSDGKGLLDLLPGAVAKDYALLHLRNHAGVHPEHLVYAGDSGNDLEAMLAGFKVVVVGNAEPDFVAELKARARQEDCLARIYFARAPFAAGVLEGCIHHGIL